MNSVESLVWQEEIKNVMVSQGFDNLKDESDWPDQHKWLADKLEKLDTVFRPRVKVLNADDWELFEDRDESEELLENEDEVINMSVVCSRAIYCPFLKESAQ